MKLAPTATRQPSVAYNCHGIRIDGAVNSPRLIRHTPVPMTMRGPLRSINRPASGLSSAETKKPNENAPAVRPRSQPNSSINGGSNSEKAVRAVTAIAIVMKAMPMITQP